MYTASSVQTRIWVILQSCAPKVWHSLSESKITDFCFPLCFNSFWAKPVGYQNGLSDATYQFKSWAVKAVQHCFTNWTHAVNIQMCQVGIFYKSWVYSPIILYQCRCISQCIPQVLVQHLLSLLLGVMHLICRLLNTLMDLKYVQLECECMVQLAWIIRLQYETSVWDYKIHLCSVIMY